MKKPANMTQDIAVSVFFCSVFRMNEIQKIVMRKRNNTKVKILILKDASSYVGLKKKSVRNLSKIISVF